MNVQTNTVPALVEGSKVFDYFAFISYKHLDKSWARWVQKQLEHYRLPNRLCREMSTPKYVSPIFRDETDLAGGKTVHDHLLEKIGQCKFLIVICSRHMQIKPEYIDYEVEAFLAAGNPASRILPLIVDGEANSTDPEKECLPPSILAMGEKMPLGIALNPKDRKETVLKLIASILEIDLQSLRSHNQERRQRRILAAMGGGLVLSLALGAFMAWETLSVKQAGLREQLTYAADTFRQGDRLNTAAISAGVEQEYIPLMDASIRREADKLALLSAIHPKYLPLTRLAPVSADSRALFTADGRHVMIITSTAVRKFDMAGREVMHYELSPTAHRIVDVCSDGVHAVIMTQYLPDLDGTRLWLWNMETDQPRCELVYSAEYGQDNARMGYLSGVVDAAFSPDGKMVCAYRSAEGYFNLNDELAAWDVQTGEKLFSFPGTLLGSKNQPFEVAGFTYLNNNTLYWEGSSNHVFYTLGDAAPVVIRNRDLPSVRDKTTVSLNHKRYSLSLAQPGSLTLRDIAADATLSFPSGEDVYYTECAGRYLLITIEDQGKLSDLAVVDLPSMTLLDSAAFGAACRGRALTGVSQLEGSTCLYLTLDNSDLYRFDLATGDFLPLRLPNAPAYSYIARTGSTDVLAAPMDGRTALAEVEGDALRRYTIDADYDRFAASAAFSPTADSPYMAAEHNGSYYLHPLAHPGEMLAAGSEDARYAASPDGRLIVMGSGAELSAWQDGQPVLQQKTDGEILSLGAADNGFFALTKTALTRYDPDGGLLATLAPPEGYIFLSARITADGSRIALLSGYASNLADNAYRLELLSGSDLRIIARVSDVVHVAPASVHEIAYDVSPNGQWVSAVVRIAAQDSAQYELAVSVWHTEDGRLAAQTLSVRNDDVPVFDTMHSAGGIASSYRLQYTTFASGGQLLAGLQYGTWVFDMDTLSTVTFLAEGENCDALPDMLSSGQLLYPARGLRVWDAKDGRLAAAMAMDVAHTEINAMLHREGQNRLYVSRDQAWAALSGASDTYLYPTGDWASHARLAAQSAQVLCLNDQLLVYATPDGLWRLSLHP